MRVIEFSPDGNVVASGGYDGTVKLWDVSTGREIRTISAHDDVVESLVFAIDGKTLATGGLNDPVIKIWDVITGRLKESLASEGVLEAEMSPIAYSSDSKRLAGLASDSREDQSGIVLWDTTTWKRIGFVQGVFTRGKVAFNMRGTKLAFAHGDSPILLDINTRTERPMQLVPQMQAFEEIRFSSDGAKLLSLGNNGVNAWNVHTGAFLHTFKCPDNSRTFRLLDLSLDGETAACIDPLKKITISRVISGERTAELPNTFSEREGELAAKFSPEGSVLAVTRGRESGTSVIEIWNPAEGKMMSVLRGYAKLLQGVQLSPDGTWLATGSSSGPIKLWNLTANLNVNAVKMETSDFPAFAFGHDSSRLFIVSEGVQDLVLATGDVAVAVPPGRWELDDPRLALAAAGGKVVISNMRGGLIIWDKNSKTSKILEPGEFLAGFRGTLRALSIDPTGKFLAVGRYDGNVAIFDLASGKKLFSVCGQREQITSIAFSRDGKLIVTASSEAIKICEIASKKIVRTFVGPNIPSTPIYSLTSSGNILIGAGLASETTVRLINVTDRREIASLISFGESEWAVVSPDGRFDTNLDLNRIEGLHWMLSDDPLTPKPLELFMRQYYEPGLLRRLLKCNENGGCDTEFKPLPSIAAINRVQPGVVKPRISAPK